MRQYNNFIFVVACFFFISLIIDFDGKNSICKIIFKVHKEIKWGKGSQIKTIQYKTKPSDHFRVFCKVRNIKTSFFNFLAIKHNQTFTLI